ncbi:MAG: flagellar motor switch protein FliN [Mycobacterium leprae]
MEAMISQTEIDALMLARQQANAAPPARLQDSDLPLLTGLLSDFVQRALASATAVTGAACEGMVSDAVITPSTGVSNLGSPQVFVGSSRLAGGLVGSLYYVVPSPFGLLMMAELEKNAPPESSPKASIQAMGDFLTLWNEAGFSALGDVLGAEVTEAAVAAAVAGSLAEKSLEAPGSPLVSVSVDLAVGDAMGRLLLVIPETVAMKLVTAVKAKQQPEPAAPVLPQAAGETTPALPAEMEVTPVEVPATQPAAPAPALAPTPAPTPDAEVAAAAAAAVVDPTPSAPSVAPAPAAAVPPPRNLELLKDVVLQVTVELGRTHRKLKDVLALAPGSVMELDRLANEQVDVMVNGRPIAKAEVVVVDENYGARVTTVVSPGERVRTFG